MTKKKRINSSAPRFRSKGALSPQGPSWQRSNTELPYLKRIPVCNCQVCDDGFQTYDMLSFLVEAVTVLGYDEPCESEKYDYVEVQCHGAGQRSAKRNDLLGTFVQIGFGG